MYIGINARHILGEKDGVGHYTYHLVKNLLKLDSDNKYVLLCPQKFPYRDWLNKSLLESRVKLSIKSKLSRLIWNQVLLPLESQTMKSR